jgi:excisionase family DNA binding protein
MPADTQPTTPSRLEDLPPFLTVLEAAAVLRLGKTATYDAITRGEIPSVRFGKKLRVPRGAIAHLAREQLVSTPAGRAADQGEPVAGGIGDHTADQPR